MRSLVLGLLVLSCVSAAARDRRPAAPPVTASQLVDEFDARLAVLKADMRLTDDQNPRWDTFRAALHDMMVDRAANWSERGLTPSRPTRRGRESPRAGKDGPQANATAAAADAGTTGEHPGIVAMRLEADELAQRSDYLTRVANVASPLLATLNDGQSRLLLEFVDADGPRLPRRDGRRRER